MDPSQPPVNQRNMVLAIALSVLVIVAWSVFFSPTPPPQPSPGQPPVGSSGVGAYPATTPGMLADDPATSALNAALPVPRDQAIARTPRVAIQTPRLHGSINLVGGRIDDLRLAGYYETLERAQEVILLTPQGAEAAYYAETGWKAGGEAGPVPGADTLWQADGEVLGVDQPVTLTWDNGQGLRFERVIAVDQDYMFTVTDRVHNSGAAAATVQPVGVVRRFGTPPTLGLFILHEGPIGVFADGLVELDYDDLVGSDATPVLSRPLGNGWLGITDKYWLVAMVPDAGADAVQATALGSIDSPPLASGRLYQAGFQKGAQSVAPGASAESITRIFAGAKEVNLLDAYGEALGIRSFDLAVDFGWFYFLTKPYFHVLDYLRQLLGSFGLAILAMTVLVKLAMFPLANKSYVSMNRMKALQPEMEKLRARHRDDPQAMQRGMMELYRKEKVNPLSGCLPIIVQIPVFFALYKVLFVSIEMRHTPFFGWIDDLSAPDPTTWLNLFGLIPWDPRAYTPDIINLGIWPIIMGVTMYVQTLMNPKPPDPMQARITQLLPFFFTFLLATFPAGLVIYWAWNNTLSILQQYFIKKRMEAREAREKAAKAARSTGETKVVAKDALAKDALAKEAASVPQASEPAAATAAPGPAVLPARVAGPAVRPKTGAQKGKGGKPRGRR